MCLRLAHLWLQPQESVHVLGVEAVGQMKLRNTLLHPSLTPTPAAACLCSSSPPL
jgi:hypothetical protein